MKNIITISIFTILIIIYSGCTLNTPQDNYNDIEFNVIYTGFTFFDGTAANMPPITTYVFTSNEDWDNFHRRYLPGVNNVMTMNRNVDFNKYSLIYTGTIGADPTYSSSVTIDEYILENKELKPIFKEEEKNIYAHNDGEEFVHIFVILSLVEREYLTDDLRNVFVKNK